MLTSRRHFLRQAGLGTTLAAVSGTPLRAAAPARANPPADGIPRHIIHLVADGTSSGTLTVGDYFSRLVRGHGLRWLELYQRPDTIQALVNMRSLNSVVTDSAAASTSWGSGSRVKNGVLNILPDGRELRPVCPLFAQAGWKRGLVTTTEITHATPAGFVANAKRDNAESIAVQYLDRNIEVLLGGGGKFFAANQRKDKRDLLAAYRAAGYTVATNAAELAAAPLSPRLLGVFSEGHLPYTLDHQADAKLRARVPTLADMTRRALRKLGREDRFILQVEGGRVDHAAHANDIAAAAHELLAFDDALAACLEFQQREPETLLVITTDHGTANAGLNSSGGGYSVTPPPFTNLRLARASFSEIARRLGSDPAPGRIQRLVQEATGYKVPDAKAVFLASFFAKKGWALYDAMNSPAVQLGQLLGNHYGVGWTSGEHTADYVPLIACGPGAARFRGFLQNTDVFRHYVALAGIDYRNPEAPLMVECGPSATEAEALAARV
jgi:alkaline phosphatase